MKKIMVMVTAAAMISGFAASMPVSYAAGTAGSACDVKGGYNVVNSWDFEKEVEYTVFTHDENGQDNELSVTTGIVVDDDNANNHVYKMQKNDEHTGTTALVFTTDKVSGDSGKYIISYDLKVAEKADTDHLVTMKVSPDAGAANTVINGNTGGGVVLNVIRAGKSKSMDTQMTASYAKTLNGDNWKVFSEIGETGNDNPTVNLDYNTWHNVKVLIDTSAGSAEYYYNDEYLGTQENESLKNGVKVIQLQTYQGWRSDKPIQIDNVTVKSTMSPIISYDFDDNTTLPGSIEGQIGEWYDDNGNGVLKLTYNSEIAKENNFARLNLPENSINEQSGRYVLEYKLKYFEDWTDDTSVVGRRKSPEFYCQAVCNGTDGSNIWYPMNAVRGWSDMNSRLTYAASTNKYYTTETWLKPKNGEWMNIRVEIDVGNNLAEYYFDNIYAGKQAISGYGYSSGISAVAFEIEDNGVGRGKVYIDNISLKKLIGSFEFYVDSLGCNSTDEAWCTVVNTTDSSKTCYLIYAVYEKNGGRFVRCGKKEITAEHLVQKDSLSFSLEAGQTVRAYIWNGFGRGIKKLY